MRRDKGRGRIRHPFSVTKGAYVVLSGTNPSAIVKLAGGGQQMMRGRRG